MLDEHAPQKFCFVVDRPMVPWYTDTIYEVKHVKRKLGKQMKRTGLTVHREMFKTAKTELRVLLEKARPVVYTPLPRKSSVLPSYASKQSLALVSMVKQTLN